MQAIYVCSPYRGDIRKNTKYAIECCKRKVMDSGKVPIAPHLFFPHFIDEETERGKALRMNEKPDRRMPSSVGFWRCDNRWHEIRD